MSSYATTTYFSVDMVWNIGKPRLNGSGTLVPCILGLFSFFKAKQKAFRFKLGMLVA